MKRILFFFICIYISHDLLFAQPLSDPGDIYYSIQSSHFIVHFPIVYKKIALDFLKIAEEIHEKLEPFYLSKARQTHLVLIFQQDIANAYTTTYGLDLIIFYISQPELFNFANYKNWIRQLIVHEYTHILTLRQYQGFSNYLFRFLFGIPPNHALPNGILEGISVYEESKKENQISIGRLFDSQTHSLFYQQLLYGNFPSFEEMLGGSYRWPLGDIVYLYGGRYVNFIIQNYSKENFLQIFHSTSLPLFLNQRFKNAGLENPESLYKSFIQNEIYYLEKRLTNKDDIITPFEQITFDGGIKKYLKSENNSLFYFSQSYDKPSGIYQIAENQTFKIIYKAIDVKDFSLDKDKIITSEPIFLNQENIIRHNIFINAKRIFYDKERRLYPIYKKSLFYFKYKDPYIYLIFYDEKNQNEKILLERNISDQFSSLAYSNDQLFFILKKGNSTEYEICKCNLNTNECYLILKSHHRISSLSINENHLLFSSDLDGNFEIYDYHLETNIIKKITNSPISKSFPTFYKGDIYFLGENSNGFDIYRIPSKFWLNTNVSQFSLEKIYLERYITDDTINLDQIQEKKYSLRHFHLFFDGILKDSYNNIYLQISGFDPLNRHLLNLGIQFSQNYDTYFINYTYNRFLPKLNISYYRTNPFHNDKNCLILASKLIKNLFCKKVFGTENHTIGFSYPYFFRLIKNNGEIGFSFSKIRNAFDYSPIIYQHENFDQKSIFFKYQIWYFEQYILSISPENGWRFYTKIEHFPYKWNFIQNQDSKTFYEYTDITHKLEFFLPFFFKNHVPYMTIFSNYHKGKNFDFSRTKLSNFQRGIALLDSPSGTGNIVLTFEYRFPLLYASQRIFSFLPELGIHWISLSPFYELGKSYMKDLYEKKPIFHSRGIRLNAKVYAFYLPFFISFTYSKGTEEQYSFGFSLNINYDRLTLPLELHLEHPQNSWNYR